MPDIIYIFVEIKKIKNMIREELSRETRIVESAKSNGYDLKISYSVSNGKEFPEQVTISGVKLVDGLNNAFNASATSKSFSINHSTGERDIALEEELRLVSNEILGL